MGTREVLGKVEMAGKENSICTEGRQAAAGGDGGGRREEAPDR